MNVCLEYPYTAAKVRSLRVGDVVQLAGRVVTGRDRFHRYLADGGKPPIDLKDGAIYHCGPVVVQRDGRWVVQAAGPTTSGRLDGFLPAIIDKNEVRVVIGKGGMGEATRRACARGGCVYLHAVGGAASLLARKVERVESVHFLKEFGAAEAVWVLTVKDFPAVVTMDARGWSLHRRISESSQRALAELLR